MAASKGQRFMFWCANEHQNFRIPEFEALSRLFKIPLNWVEKNTEKPWLIIDLASEKQARTLISRSISTRFCVQLWARASNYCNLHEEVKAFPDEIKTPLFKKENSFKFMVESFYTSWSLQERIAKIETFDYLTFEGPVNLKSPEVTMGIFEFFGLDHNNLSPEPLDLFFGRLVGEGQRDLIQKLSIKKRKFIGNTTMDPQLALLMANMACVEDGDLVIDPFVGTGSLLIAAAQFGGFVLGTDIDFLMVHARTRPSRQGMKKRAVDESMRSNFEQYGLQDRYLDVLVSDSSKPVWSRRGVLDAVIADPPYGIREKIEKVGTTKVDLVIPAELVDKHIPQKIDYEMSDVFSDLLDFGADYLVEGGRLVYWLPINREDYSEDKLPKHPRLRLDANCEQVLSSHTSRRLIVMTKLTEAEVEASGADSDSGANAENLPDFREKFYAAQRIPRTDRMDRVKKFGHLNMDADKSSD